MKNPSLWEAMAHMDPLLIEEADRPVARRRRSVGRTLCIAAAACLLLAVGVLASEELFGFRILEVRNDEEGARHSLSVEDAVYFPAEQFSKTVQERLAAGGDPTTVLEELPTSGEGTASAARIEVDVPKFDTYAEAAAYLGEDIPLAPESTALAGRLGQQIHVSTNRNAVTLSTVYSIEETGVLFSANVFVEGGTPPTFGSYYGYTGEVELRQETAQTGTGCPALIYHTAGEHNTCEAYFIREGIVYNLFLTDTNDMSVLQRILDTF
jgi:hypothetical protein